MTLQDTVFSISGIIKRMPKAKRPKTSAVYLFGKGLYKGTLSKEQVQSFEDVIDFDYKAAKSFLQQAKKQIK